MSSDSDSSSLSSSSSSSSGSDDNSNPYDLPISHQCNLIGHDKCITTITLDKNGGRLLTGSMDYTVKMWDFNGMTSDLKSFRMFEPCEGHPITSLKYSNSGDVFLCCTGNAKPKLYNRDGFEQCEYTRGDMYLHDMKYTKGHITGITNCYWHPLDKKFFITCAADKTIRLWDVNYIDQNYKVAIFKSSIQRLNVTCCTYSPNGKIIAGAAVDGTIQMFDKDCRHINIIKNAHIKNTEVGGLCFSRDNHTLVSRGSDSTLKVWDIRKVNEAAKIFNITNSSRFCNIMFNPTEQLLVTGYGKSKENKKGGIIFIDRRTMKEYQRVSVSDADMTSVIYHPKLKQIITGNSLGTTHVLYDPNISYHGALLCVGKAPRKKDPSDFVQFQNITNPNALKEKANTARLKSILAKRRMPEPPMSTDLGSDGRVGSTWQSYISKQMVDVQFKNQDSRQELLKRAKIAEENPFFFGKAYKDTQPVPVFQQFNEEELKEEEELNKIANQRQQ